MSIKSLEANMRKLADLLSQNLSYVRGERENGPNGVKRTFLNLGKAFLRALAKDLGLRDVRVMSNPGGIAVSGQCCLYGMWVDSGIFISIEQPCLGDNVLLYRTIRSITDHAGGCNHYLRLCDLERLSYERVLQILSDLNPAEGGHAHAA